MVVVWIFGLEQPKDNGHMQSCHQKLELLCSNGGSQRLPYFLMNKRLTKQIGGEG
jgi:hypothetical protein